MAKKEGDIERKAALLTKIQEPELLLPGWLEEWSEGRGRGIINWGEAICDQPIDQKFMLNPTTPLGHGNLLFAKMTYSMPKYQYCQEKVEEHIAVSPVYHEMYGRVIAKKAEVEGHVKSGLASAAQAVADYELLLHDERKYREILDYFEQGKKDEHVLRALFVDRIDAHTGEGYSMISMTKRWPTIITDFLRMSDVEKKNRNSPRLIREKLEISEAEATVLKTKDKVYEEWKRIFFPDIRDRYVRIKNLVEARRKSVDEYREWLMALVTNLKMLKEISEVEPSMWLTEAIAPWHKPNAIYGARVWMWKDFSAEDLGKTGFVSGEIKPYDDFAKRYAKRIEQHYGIKILETRKELKDIEKKEIISKDDYIIVNECLKKWAEASFYESGPKLDSNRYMYAFYDLQIINPILKMEGQKEEVDDWNLLTVPYLVSQNVILVMLLEVEAKKKWFNKYVKELIGVPEIEDKLREEINERYPDLEGEEPGEKRRLSGVRNFFSGLKRRYSNAGRGLDEWWIRNKLKAKPFLRFFIRMGPYETVRQERLTKMYGRYMGGTMTDPFIAFIKYEIGKLSGVQPP